MDGRHAAQDALGQIERCAIVHLWIDEQRYRPVAGIGDCADALTQIQPPGLRRDVGRGVPQPDIRLESRLASLGNDLAMPIFAEAVGHHPVIASDRLHPANREFAELSARGRLLERLQNRLCDGDRQSLPGLGAHGLDVYADGAARSMGLQMACSAIRPWKEIFLAGRGAFVQPGPQQHAASRRAEHFLERPPQHRLG